MINQLVIKKIGSLSNNDKIKVQSMLKQLFNLDDNSINKLGIIPLKNEGKIKDLDIVAITEDIKTTHFETGEPITLYKGQVGVAV